jgi:hypothetical protein
MPLSGEGRVISWVRFHKVYHPAFEGSAPYVVVFVELKEGPRLIGNLVAGSAETSTGMKVSVVFEEHDGFTLPQFQPVQASSGPGVQYG